MQYLFVSNDYRPTDGSKESRDRLSGRRDGANSVKIVTSGCLTVGVVKGDIIDQSVGNPAALRIQTFASNSVTSLLYV